ncbi:hypothetical protein [Bacillus sp. (in: firmicutes)]|uniref:hypothetical protein n=1 Tax=Bacillus sp. TaxID=1409 RepID=UPI0023F108E1|nr:hypothetical protein [Bacillus sp. (in: firmicutes)]
MTRNYDEAKKTIKYLEKRYGKFKRFSHGKQKEIQKSIILDHDKSDINRMFRKVEDDIEVAKDSQTINIQLFNFYMMMATSLLTAGIGLLSVIMLFFNNVYARYLDGKDLNEKKLLELLNPADFTPFIFIAILLFALPFILIFFVWKIQSKIWTNNIDKRYLIKTLLKECLENYNKVIK